MRVNFGGFIPLSTVDWYGMAVCTVFLRGCPVRCSYCHNRAIQDGEDYRNTEEIIDMVRGASLLVSGVVFSGGEPTMQREALLELARRSRELGLLVGLQTNGVYPETIQELINNGLVDKISLDIKARWERYDNLLKRRYASSVKRSLGICRRALEEHEIREFEVVVTLFAGYEDEVKYISRETEGVNLVLQQGVEGKIPPLTCEDLMRIADGIGRYVKIRTRDRGEIGYQGDRSRGLSGKRQG
ncbi:MAG: anaerobic ribonucleoside-triphosphate reductase activating protein [Methanomicrobiales archaeon]|nr:anaerobic ribonucleoside-triphosphate reductase activating protein [Methanomicrobiales archaeon]